MRLPLYSLRGQLRRERSGSTVKIPHSEQPDRNGSAEPDENTGLISRHVTRIITNEAGQPYYKDERLWVRWPAMAFYLTWEVLKTNYLNVLLVFVPLGIVA